MSFLNQQHSGKQKSRYQKASKPRVKKVGQILLFVHLNSRPALHYCTVRWYTAHMLGSTTQHNNREL